MIKVLLHPKVLEKIRHWTALAKGEFSALGLVEKNGDDLIVPEIYLPKQTCSPANTDMDQTDVARLMVDLEKQGIDPTTLRLWLHSHGDMRTFWSNTDTSTIQGLANDGFVVSIVTNKNADVLARVDCFHPFRFTFENVRTEPMLPTFDLLDACRQEFMEKVMEGADISTLVFDRSRDRREELPLFDDMEDRRTQRYLALEEKFWAGELGYDEYEDRLAMLEVGR